MAIDNNDFTHEFQIYSTDLNAGTTGTGKFLLYDDNINALKVEDISNIKIGGGTNGRVLATDGAGNLRWISAAAVTGGVSSYNDLNDLPTLFSGDYNDLTNKPTLFTANQALNTSSSVSFNRLTVTSATGIEGGEIQLAKAPSSSLAGDVIIDIYDNKIRFFESGGTSRGFYLDLSTGANNTSSNIMSDSFSGSYNDLTNKPTVATSAYIGTTQVAFNRASGALTLAGVSIDGNAATVSNGVYTTSTYANPAWITSLAYSKITGTPSLATVATSGSYVDLTNKPALFSGSYNDLTNKPSIPTVPTTVSSFSNDAGYLTSVTNITGNAGTVSNGVYTSGSYSNPAWITSLAYSKITGTPSLATVATSGAYADLSGKPTLATVATSGSYNDLANKPSLFSGAYADLTGKPTLFDGAYNSLSGTPNLAAVATSGSYNDLANKPSIPGAYTLPTSSINTLGGVKIDGSTITINANGVISAVGGGNFSGSYNDLTNKPTIPTNTNDLTNGAGFITSSDLSGYATQSWVTSQGYSTSGGGGGIPGNDGAQGPQGEPGAAGADGDPGQGVPTGGTAGQILAKIDGNDYNTEWVNQSSVDLGNITFNGDKISSTGTGVDINSTGYAQLSDDNGAFIWVENGQANIESGNNNQWAFDTDGKLTLPGSQGTFITHQEFGATTATGGWIQMSLNGDQYVYITPDEIGINTVRESGNDYRWIFDNSGNLTLPAGGDIKDSNGTSVLGGNGSYGDENVKSLLGEFNIGEATYGFNNAGIFSLTNGFYMGAPGGNAEINTNNNLSVFANNGIELATAGNDYRWNFNDGGDLILPSGGDIKRDGVSVLGGSGNSLDPYVTINEDNKVAVTSNIVFVAEQVTASGQVFTISDPNQNNDAFFEAATADGDGVMYTVGYYYDGPHYALVFASNPDGTVKWETSINQINGDTPRPNNVIYRDGYVFVGFKYYDNNQWQAGVVRLNANDGSYNNQWLLTSPNNSYPQLYDIAINNNTDPIMVGRIDGERRTITGVMAQTGSGVDMLVVNTADILPAGETDAGNTNWEIDTTGSGAWSGPNEINTFYNLPVVSVQGSGSGMTVNMRHSGGHPTYIWINQQGTGYTDNGNGQYNFGEQLKILGSSYGGVDGDNDITIYVWTYNNGNNWTIVAPQQDWSLAGNTPTDKTYFTMSGGTDYSQGGPWNLRYSLNSQAFIWTPDWQHTFGSGANSENFTSVAYDNNTGSVYIGGNFWMNSPRRSDAVYKLDAGGNLVWAKYVEDSDSLAGQSFGTVALDPTGNYLFVISQNNNDEALVTKLATDIGSVEWSVKQTNRDNNNYWNNEPRGAVDSNGDVYLTGSWTWNDGTYGLAINKLSGADGSLLWARKLNTTDNQSIYEFYNDDTQPFKVVGNNIYYAGYTYDSNGSRNIGYAVVLPTDGSGTGTYGRWKYEVDDSFGYGSVSIILGTEGSFAATDGVTQSVDGSVSVNLSTDDYGNLARTSTLFAPASGGTIEQVGSIIFADGSTQTTAAGADAPITWTNPNNNIWRIETYNGGAAVSYNGGDGELWWDASNAPSGNSQFRGAIIEYHAFIQNQGNIIGTIHVASDYSVDGATHTEHLSGNNDLNFISLWGGRGNRGQLYFKDTNGNSRDLLIQWTAKMFYGSENNC